MKFKPRFEKFRLNLDGYKKVLHESMIEAVSQGIAEWLDAVLIEIPVWSGASRATFLRLANEIKYAIPIAPVAADRQAQGMMSSRGSLTTDVQGGRYLFEYGTSLPWLIWNEYHNANVERDPTLISYVHKEGPYHFQEKGKSAFVQMAKTVRLPRVSPFVK